MASFNLPHKANIGEIIRVRGFDGILFLVEEWTEEIAHEADGTEEATVTYTCRNIDDPSEVKIIFDEDIQSIVVTADKTDDYIKNRKGKAQPPAIRNEETPMARIQINLPELLRQFEEMRQAKNSKDAAASKQARSPYEEERIKQKEAQEYLDYLLDTHSMLADLEMLLGSDETRLEEMRMLKEEFHEKSIALYGKVSKEEE